MSALVETAGDRFGEEFPRFSDLSRGDAAIAVLIIWERTGSLWRAARLLGASIADIDQMLSGEGVLGRALVATEGSFPTVFSTGGRDFDPEERAHCPTQEPSFLVFAQRHLVAADDGTVEIGRAHEIYRAFTHRRGDRPLGRAVFGAALTQLARRSGGAREGDHFTRIALREPAGISMGAA